MTQTFDDSTVPWAGGPYGIKRHGVSISNCDSEPVQTPGCIQAHGVLLVLRLSDLTILQASENTLDYLGHAPADLLGRSIATVVGSEGETRLRTFLAKEPVDRNPLYVFTFPARVNREIHHLEEQETTLNKILEVTDRELDTREVAASLAKVLGGVRGLFLNRDERAAQPKAESTLHSILKPHPEAKEKACVFTLGGWFKRPPLILGELLDQHPILQITTVTLLMVTPVRMDCIRIPQNFLP